MGRNKYNKYTACLLGLISVCSNFSKVNAMDSQSKPEEKEKEKIQNALSLIIDPKNDDAITGVRKCIHKLSRQELTKSEKEFLNPMFDFVFKNIEKKNTKCPDWTKILTTGKEKKGEFPWSLLDSGQKLWILGYDDLNFLSYGSQGVIWEDINRKKAVKVVAKEEKSDISKIKNILNDNKKYKKYFAEIEDVSFKNIDNMTVYEMPLANCDFYDVTKRKADARKNNNENKKKHIDNLLSSAKSLMKAIMVLHDLGYVHNDIKPDNLLQMQKSFSELEAKVKETNGKIVLGSEKLRFYKKNKRDQLEKIHQHRLVLSDFDTMTKIQDELDGTLKIDNIKGWLFQLIPGSGEENTGDSDKIKKRDVWAAGVSLFVMLMGEKISNYCTTNALKNKIGLPINGLYDLYGGIYYPEDKTKFIKFLEIIRNMVHAEPSKRYTAEQAYNAIKKLIEPESTK